MQGLDQKRGNCSLLRCLIPREFADLPTNMAEKTALPDPADGLQTSLMHHLMRYPTLTASANCGVRRH